jgi:hypothetical protein
MNAPAERPSVRRTVDFSRVERLPRRALDPLDADAWAAVFTDELIAPHARAMALAEGHPLPAVRRWQGQCLAEITTCRGAFIVLPVGHGKTFISRYAGTVLGALRPLLILPANMIRSGKTHADFRSYVGVWRQDCPPTLISREELALEKNARLLDQLQPDAIVIDEADDLANWDSAAVARLDAYIMARTREQCPVVCMSGTPTRGSILAYWHLLRWTHRDGAPVPLKRSEARTWASALDQQKTTLDGSRMAPGPLGPSRSAALQWYRERLQQTPGVIIIDGDSATKADGSPIPLRIETRLAKECPVLDGAFQLFAVDQQLPDGTVCAAPLERWRNEAFIGCGLYPRYKKPGPPRAWRDERRRRSQAFAKLCRETKRNTRGWTDPAHTERQVRRRHAVSPDTLATLELQGVKLPPWLEAGRQVIAEWDEYADDPWAKEIVWISDATLETARAYLAESDKPAIIWTGGVEFGQALARLLGLSYFGREGKDQHGNELHSYPPGRSFVCSWYANKKGFNLQHWLRHGVFNPPTSAKWLEQMFGRSHRSGVDDAGVTFTLFATSGGTLDAIDAAVAEANFARASVGPTQKILRAQFKRERPRLTPRNKYRWARA